jgi:hypothetical protein
MKPERQLVSLAGKVRKLLAKLVHHQMDYGLKESKDSVEHADTYLGGRYEMWGIHRGKLVRGLEAQPLLSVALPSLQPDPRVIWLDYGIRGGLENNLHNARHQSF